MKKKACMVLCVIIILLLNACGKNVKKNNIETEIPSQYSEVPMVFRYEQEYCPLRLVGLSSSSFYFYQRTDWVKDEEAYWQMTFYKQPLSKNIAPKSLHISLNNSFLSSTYITEEGILYLMLLREEGNKTVYQLVGYSEGGEQIANITLPDELSRDTILEFLVMKDGKLCILTTEILYVLDNRGMLIKAYKCGGSLYQDILKIDEDNIAATYCSDTTGKSYFTILNNNTMSEVVAISGNGKLICSDNKSVYFVDTGHIYALDIETNNITKQMNLSGRNIDLEQIAGAAKTDNGFAFLGYGLEQNTVRYVEFNRSDTLIQKSENYDVGGKRCIYLYDYSFNDMNHAMLERIIEIYNEQSNLYKVELRDYGYAYVNADDFDPLKIITADEFPDIIFSDSNQLIDLMIKNNCLEDLGQYIMRSKKISFSDIVEPIKNVYFLDEKVYAIPRMFSLTSIVGKEAQMGYPGWTVDEFMQWMLEHPDLQAMMNLTQSGVLDICIETVIEMCIDDTNGGIDLHGTVFKSFLEKMKRLNLSNTVSKPNFEMGTKLDMGYIAEANIETFQRTAYENYMLGEESVYKGYPSIEGKPKAYLHAYTLSMFTSCQVKEGAYDFIEFFLTYEGDEWGNNEKIQSSRIYTLENNLKHSVEKALQTDVGDMDEFSVTQEQIDKIIEIFPYAVERKNKYTEIREIIEEEIPAYLGGQKDLDSVCKIIQSRVQLYLDEMGSP